MLAACTAEALSLLTDQTSGIPLHATFINTQLQQGLSGLTSLSPFEKTFFDKEAGTPTPTPATHTALSPQPLQFGGIRGKNLSSHRYHFAFVSLLESIINLRGLTVTDYGRGFTME